MGEAYRSVAVIVFWLTFVVTWIGCALNYGFLLGVGLGWLPALVVAGIAALCWPVLAIGYLLTHGHP